jgi:hypothetical protein
MKNLLALFNECPSVRVVDCEKLTPEVANGRVPDGGSNRVEQRLARLQFNVEAVSQCHGNP